MVSGGWVSSHSGVSLHTDQPLLDRGDTVFAVVHGSQPRFIVSEIAEDIHRGVRFVRSNAARGSVDPDKFGVSGSRAVPAVACFYPPTDFLNWSEAGEDFWDYPPTRKYSPALGPRWETQAGRQSWGPGISPLCFVAKKMPLTRFIQGNADVTVPLYQSQLFEQKCKEVGAPFKLIVKSGAGHSYPGWRKDVTMLADWFDEHLLGLTGK